MTTNAPFGKSNCGCGRGGSASARPSNFFTLPAAQSGNNFSDLGPFGASGGSAFCHCHGSGGFPGDGSGKCPGHGHGKCPGDGNGHGKCPGDGNGGLPGDGNNNCPGAATITKTRLHEKLHELHSAFENRSLPKEQRISRIVSAASFIQRSVDPARPNFFHVLGRNDPNPNNFGVLYIATVNSPTFDRRLGRFKQFTAHYVAHHDGERDIVLRTPSLVLSNTHPITGLSDLHHTVAERLQVRPSTTPPNDPALQLAINSLGSISLSLLQTLQQRRCKSSEIPSIDALQLNLFGPAPDQPSLGTLSSLRIALRTVSCPNNAARANLVTAINNLVTVIGRVVGTLGNAIMTIPPQQYLRFQTDINTAISQVRAALSRCSNLPGSGFSNDPNAFFASGSSHSGGTGGTTAEDHGAMLCGPAGDITELVGGVDVQGFDCHDVSADRGSFADPTNNW